MKNKIIIYADGGCRGNGKSENLGAYAAILRFNNYKKEFSGVELNTTNNRMELMSCIIGLEALKKFDFPVEVFMDSQYVVSAINEGWLNNWVKNNWKKADKSEVLNKDLWARLLNSLNKIKDIKFTKCKGHSNDQLNEEVDALVNSAMDNKGENICLS